MPTADLPLDLMGLIQKFLHLWEMQSPLVPSEWEPPIHDVLPLSPAIVGGDSRARFHYYSHAEVLGRGPWEPVRRIAGWPFMYRLSQMKQLSTVSLGLNMEATHHRYSHALGTLDIAAEMIRYGTWECPEPDLPTGPEVSAVLLLALAHDAFHGPFGHSLDRVCDLILTRQGIDRIDKALLAENIQRALKKKGMLYGFCQMISRWTIEYGFEKWQCKIKRDQKVETTANAYTEAMVDALCMFHNPAQTTVHAPKKFWLTEIVNSKLDADRLDFLMRDTHYLRWDRNIGEKAVHSIVSRMTILPADIEMYNTSGSQPTRQVNKIHWSADDKVQIEHILQTRDDLYMKIYESPRKRQFDEMLSHALIYMLQHETKNAGDLSAALTSIATMTDDELLHLMLVFCTKPENLVPFALVRDFKVGHPFAEVFRADFLQGDLGETKERSLELSKLFNDERVDLQRGIAREKGIDSGSVRTLDLPADKLTASFLRHIRPISHEKGQLDFLATLYLMASINGRKFEWRHALESMIWERLISKDSVVGPFVTQTICRGMANLHWPAGGPEVPNEGDILSHPLVFLSVPWVPPVEDNTDPSYASWSTDSPLCYHQDGYAVSPAEDPMKRKFMPYYPTSIYIPQIIATDSVKREVVRLFLSIVYSCSWYLPENIRSQAFPWQGGIPDIGPWESNLM